MLQETLCYEADGLALKGRLFFEAASHPRPAVLVFPEAFGLGENAVARAERLARLGYVALACDLHGEGRFVDNLDSAMDLLKPLFEDPLRTRRRAVAALHALAARPEVDADRVGAIGFCFPMPLELARSGADIKAAVGFHTVLSTNAPAHHEIKARILVCVGADDPFIPPDQRQAFEVEMRGVGAAWQMALYGATVHSFTSRDAGRRNRPDAIRYSADADRRSWASMLELLADTLGPTDERCQGQRASL